MLGNVKNAIHGTYHAIGAKHLPRYLAEFGQQQPIKRSIQSGHSGTLYRQSFASKHRPLTGTTNPRILKLA